MIKVLCPSRFRLQTAGSAPRARRTLYTALVVLKHGRSASAALAVLCMTLLLQAVSASASYKRFDDPAPASDGMVSGAIDGDRLAAHESPQSAPQGTTLEANLYNVKKAHHKKIIDSFSFNELILDTLSVRWDLRDQGGYPVEDMETVSGQYETFYEAVMGPCGRVPHDERRDLSAWVCDPTLQQELQNATDPDTVSLSLSMYFANRSIFTYLESDQRICKHPETLSCDKPNRSRTEIEAELLRLLEQQGRFE